MVSRVLVFLLMTLGLPGLYGSDIAEASHSPHDSCRAAPDRNTTQTLADEFPNFFSYLDAHEAEELLSQSIHSILSRTRIPHVWQDELRWDGFFEHLRAACHRASPSGSVYLAGGTVRSLLGYIYQKLYKGYIHIPAPAERTINRGWVRRVFSEKIIKARKGLSLVDVFGIGSDFDLLVDASTTEEEDDLIAAITAFVNSAETYFGIRGDTSDIKKSIVTIADVKKYSEHLGDQQHNHNAVYQGGCTLDWLAYELTDGEAFRTPVQEPDLIRAFIEGFYSYRPRPLALAFADKQVVRGLRPLLEIPFLALERQSRETLRRELADIDLLSEGARNQRKKLLRNARLEGAHNRFTRPKVFVEDQGFVDAVKTVLNKDQAIKEFLPYRPSGHDDTGMLRALGYLEDASSFRERTPILYHGTPNLDNVIYMMRGGFFLSHRHQGSAAYGRGVYTATSRDGAKVYSGEKGHIVQVRIRDCNTLRIVDFTSPRGVALSDFLAEECGARSQQDQVELLARAYDIDLIAVSATIVLIENRAAIKLKKDLQLLYDAFLADKVAEMRRALAFQNPTILEITRFFRGLHEIQGGTILSCVNGNSLQKNAELVASLWREFSVAFLAYARQVDPHFSEQSFYRLVKSIIKAGAMLQDPKAPMPGKNDFLPHLVRATGYLGKDSLRQIAPALSLLLVHKRATATRLPH